MKAVVSIIMGSTSDMPIMKKAADFLNDMQIPFEINALSAHRVPQLVEKFATNARTNGIKVIIAGAGGAAHLPGMISALTSIPVLGVPIESKKLKGLDSLLSIVQMPKGIPVGSLAIGEDGAINAALLASAIIAINIPAVKKNLKNFRASQTKSVKKRPK